MSLKKLVNIKKSLGFNKLVGCIYRVIDIDYECGLKPILIDSNVIIMASCWLKMIIIRVHFKHPDKFKLMKN